MAFEPTGDSGGNSAPIGAEPSTSTSVAEPSTPLELSDDTLIKVKGSDKPVKFSDHTRGFQAQFTKASQEAARLKQELAARDAKLAEFERSRNQSQQQSQPQGGQEDIFSSLEKLPYLSGPEAAKVVQSIQQQIQGRDKILVAALQQMQKMSQIVNGLHETSQGQSFDSKINNWLKAGGYPAEASELAKEIYLAYEGDDLDNEFPQIFDQRWKQINSIIDAQRRSQLEAARRSPFVPGKGGQTGPNAPLQLKGNESAKQLADNLWGQWGNPGT